MTKRKLHPKTIGILKHFDGLMLFEVSQVLRDIARLSEDCGERSIFFTEKINDSIRIA